MGAGLLGRLHGRRSPVASLDGARACLGGARASLGGTRAPLDGAARLLDGLSRWLRRQYTPTGSCPPFSRGSQNRVSEKRG